MSQSESYSFPDSPSYLRDPSYPGTGTGLIAEVKAKMANTFYGEGSGSNKRSHIEEELTQSTQGTIQQPPQQQQPTGFSQMTENQPL